MTGIDLSGQGVLLGLTNYLSPSSQKIRILRELNRFRDFWLAEAIISALSGDVLSVSPSGECVTISYTGDNSKIQDAIEQLQKQVDIDYALSNLIYDLAWYGEYNLDIKTDPSKGVVGLQESSRLAPWNTYSIWDATGTQPKYILINGKAVDAGNYLVLSLPPRSSFTLPPRVRIKGLKNTGKGYWFRSGTPILKPALPKLRELYLMEIAIPGARLLNLLSPKYVGIQVPPGLPVDKVEGLLERYDNMLNRNLKIARTGYLEIEDLLGKGVYVKSVPVAGDKGQITTIDLTDSRYGSMVDELQDVRKAVCIAVGVPPSYILGEEGLGRQDALKQYVRYARKVRMITQELGRGLKELVKKHLAILGYKTPEDTIKVQFTHSINIEELDRVEYEDTLFSTISNTVSSLKGLEDSGVRVTPDTLKAYLQNKLGSLGLSVEEVPPGEKSGESGEKPEESSEE